MCPDCGGLVAFADDSIGGVKLFFLHSWLFVGGGRLPDPMNLNFITLVYFLKLVVDGRTDRQTDGPTCAHIELLSQLKTEW